MKRSDWEHCKVRNSAGIMAGRVKRGEPIGEYWLDGRQRSELFRRGVTVQELAPYDQARDLLRFQAERRSREQRERLLSVGAVEGQ